MEENKKIKKTGIEKRKRENGIRRRNDVENK